MTGNLGRRAMYSRNHRSHRMDLYACSPRHCHTCSYFVIDIAILASGIINTGQGSCGFSHFPANTAFHGGSPATLESASTSVYAHNLMLRKGPDFRIYVRWLRGQMVRTRRDVNPTFDDPESFFLEVKTGVIRANIGDIGNFLNRGGVAGSPLTNITLLADGDQIKLKGILHKLIPLPVELLGSVAATSDNLKLA